MSDSPHYRPDRRLPLLRAAVAVALSIPALVYGLWEHDDDSLLRVGACLLWLAFGYWWGWQDRATTSGSDPHPPLDSAT